MDRFSKVREDFSKLYKPGSFETIQPKSVEQQAFSFACYSIDFIQAAGLIDRGYDLWLPRVLLLGHAVECMLKSCILLDGNQPKSTHDLLLLCEGICAASYEISDAHIAFVAHLQHTYYRDFLTGTRFKCRYPTDKSEAVSGVLPSTESFAEILDCLRKQLLGRATGANKQLFASVCNRPLLDRID